MLNKSLGAELIDLNLFGSREEHVDVLGRSSHDAKKAKSRGYIFYKINKNNYLDDIHKINTSMGVRQGRNYECILSEKSIYYESIKTSSIMAY